MGIWMVFLLIVVAVLVWAITHWTHQASHPAPLSSGTTSARDLLDERLARFHLFRFPA